MPSQRARSRGQTGLVVALVLAALALVAVPLALHLTQKRHDVLPFDVAAEYPPDRPFVPGEIYASTLAALVERELSGLSGWRPNDFVLWGPGLMADNNAHRQLGIITAVRESTRVLKDHLTKVSSTEFDPNLVQADTAFRNDIERFWFPSAESKLREGVAALRRYVDGLRATPPASKPLNGRNVELIRLFQTWGDQLGDAHAQLLKETEADGTPVRPWRNDDYYYHAMGLAHVMHHLVLAVSQEYRNDFANRPALQQLLAEVADVLGRAGLMKPFVVLDGSPTGLFANHRRNLDAEIADARQKMYSIREELEK